MLPDIVPGPWLLSSRSPDLTHHRNRYGAVPRLRTEELAAITERAGLVGRGGAGFPFAVKLRTAASARALGRHVVVNLSEGEPASAKDVALVMTAPHLILDGAALAATALGVRTVHVVVPHEHAVVTHRVERAIRERAEAGEDLRLRWQLHQAQARFVAGEASAVTELIAGRANLPVTSWEPTAVRGIGGRPTLLSNAESYAQAAALVLSGAGLPGTADEPGTRLLSITRGARIQVEEVPHGTPWSGVLTAAEIAGPVLLGGYHGQWVPAGGLRGTTVSAGSMKALGVGLGAGVVLPLPAGTCPLTFTAHIVRYLAGQSAGRCGPCVNGLPVLAATFEDLVAGRSGTDIDTITELLRGRGACAHPDGTVRLVASACAAFAEDLIAHSHGGCLVTDTGRAWSA